MRISPTNRPQIFITMGDPSGIGPEVISKSMASSLIEGLAIFVIIGDAGVMGKSLNEFYSGRLNVCAPQEEIVLSLDAVNIIDPGSPLEDIEPGRPRDAGSRKALECLKSAVSLMRESSDESPKALVTAPLSKERVARIHPGFIGHTEYLQEAYSSDFVTMVFVGQTLCVVPIIRHVPLKDVPRSITKELIVGTLKQVADNRMFISGKEDARIGIAALNPHSGEGGRIGTEEIEIIEPAVEEARALYKRIEGPISADVIFYRAIKKEIDIVVSMYHDQCLTAFKMLDFDNGVNMTLGLGHMRTSPDHGTAFNIAGTQAANPLSMERAIKLAVSATIGK